MKLIIQIPCFNEEENISEVLNNIPKKIKNVDEISIVVLDDGSQDNTVKIAKKYSIDVISTNKNTGLSNIFKIGINNALKEKADILVNIDGDNQYCAKDIEKLIQPIINKNADITIGVRPIDKIKNFTRLKKNLQKFGSLMVKFISGIDIKDAPSGFRAFSKEALLKLNVFNNFTYTIETIIQAKNKNLIIENVDISVNEQKNRKSKLFKNNFDYIKKQTLNLIRFFIIYRPFKFFNTISIVLFVIGFLLGLRFLYYFINHSGAGHIQSLILCSIVLILSFILFNIAILGELLSINRKLLENIQYEIRENKYKK